MKRRLISLAARLYPAWWRQRYGDELNGLLAEIEPAWRDVGDLLVGAVSMKLSGAGSLDLQGRLIGGSPWHLGARPAITGSFLILLLAMASFAVSLQYSIRPLRLPVPPPPATPPAPAPPVEITDPRVFSSSMPVYSSLPLTDPGPDRPLFTHVVPGVGIRFPLLPDMGTMYWQRTPLRRIWPAQALEGQLRSRVIPKFPLRWEDAPETVSVYLEYLIRTDGSVHVLRSLGPRAFARSAAAAMEQWAYNPVMWQGRRIEVVSRVEVVFRPQLLAAGN